VGDLTTYVNQSNLAAVDAATASTPYRHHWLWVARLDGIWQVPDFKPFERPAAVQVATAAMTGIHADGSLVYNYRWHPAAS
jgi:hypothetical protein